MELKEIDLNLLVVFNQLMIDRTVSGAARSLKMSQPTVSNALRRLRQLLEDDLFVRIRNQMEPTPLAKQLAEPLGISLSAITVTLNQGQSFDPKSSSRSFNLAMTDIGESYILPKLIDSVKEQAPNIKITIIRPDRIDLRHAMETGAVDFAVGFAPLLQGGFMKRNLAQEEFVCVFRENHELDGQQVDLEKFYAADHLAVTSPVTSHLNIEQELDKHCEHRKVMVTVPHFVSVGHVLKTTNLIATVPTQFAFANANNFGLKYVPHPVKSLPEVEVALYWHEQFHRHPPNNWLRNLIYSTLDMPLALS